MENKHCPRCNAPFVCKADDIANCQCSVLIFTALQKKQMGATYSDCLCRKCLLQLQDNTNDISSNQ